MSWLESLKNPSEIVTLWGSHESVDFISNLDVEVKLPRETFDLCCTIITTTPQNRTVNLSDLRIQHPIAYLPSDDDSFYDLIDGTVRILSAKDKTVQIWDCRKLSCPVETKSYEELSKVSYFCNVCILYQSN